MRAFTKTIGQSWSMSTSKSSERKEYREPLLLQIIGGFSGKEIALILGLNDNTVMTRLFRGRRKVINQFAPKSGKISPQLFEIK